MAAAEYVRSATTGQRTFQHVESFVNALEGAGVAPERRAPILLPEYRGKAALARMIDVW